MPTKKTQTKKTSSKSKKVAFVKHAPFDLVVDTQAKANEMVEHLTIMRNTAGWHLLKQILEGNMAVLENAIVTKTDPFTGEALGDDVCDQLRFKHAYLKELTTKPESLIAEFGKTAGIEVPTYDPYATDPRQLRGDGSVVGAPMARTLADL